MAFTILGFTFGKKEKETGGSAPGDAVKSSLFYGDDMRYTSPWVPITYKTFNGEKNAGELGAPVNLIPDYRSLRIRAHEVNLTSDIIKIITGRFFAFVLGTGLKMQAQPNTTVLQLEKAIGAKENLRDFIKNSEGYWKVYAESTVPDVAGKQNLHGLALDFLSSEFIGGDNLTVLRLDDNLDIKVQVIDGQHVQTPMMDAALTDQLQASGNIILHGIEFDKDGRQVAFYVLKMATILKDTKYERIEAIGKDSGCEMAWISYGKKQRIDHKRGIPAYTSVIETVKKLNRYTEASVSKAEENAKVAWFIHHGKSSDGEDPMVGNIKRSIGAQAQDTGFEMADATARYITSTENKTVYNMPVDSELKALSNPGEINYEVFWKAIFVQICAAVDIPPEVALQQYNSNYSASRAAINAWGHIVDIYRKKLADDFYQKVYNLWLYVHILKNKVQAPGYLKALDSKNAYVTNSYSAARWRGVNMPHIDPLKEAKAIREMLGDMRAGIAPLISYEQATEQLGNGEFAENYKQWQEEMDLMKNELPKPDAEDTTQVKVTL